MASDKQQPPLSITSLRGGLNDSDPALSLNEDQCTTATNVEFFESMLGERRSGCTPLAASDAGFNTHTGVFHIAEWYPGGDPSEPEWWGMAGTIGSGTQFAYRPFTGAGWTKVTPDDAPLTTSPEIYQVQSEALASAIALNFFAYASAVDRMHVWDRTYLRRAGLAEPAAPALADSAAAGAYAGVRYFRVRFIGRSGTTIVRRSEPSLSATITPSGANTGVVVTRPALLSERETHWEIEASTDDVNFYLLTTVAAATTTYTDTTVYATGYSAGTLSEAIGDYLTLPSARYLTTDGDRLVLGGHQTDATLQSTVWWTPPSNDPGKGNAERLPLSVNNSLTLDNGAGGAVTGIESGVYGTWYAFKWQRVYQMTRTGDDSRAYTADTLSTTQGAIPGSVFKGVDEHGNACVYFTDPFLGPSRVGANGIQIIKGIRRTWKRINLHATVPAVGVFYPYKRQAQWCVAVDGSNFPNLKLISQVSELQESEGGELSRGWSLATGLVAEAFCMANLSEVAGVDDLDSLTLRPAVGVTSGKIERCDIGDDDDGAAYVGTIKTKPYIPAGLLGKWGAMIGALLAEPNNVARVKVSLIVDFGAQPDVTETIDLRASGDEEYVLRVLGDLVAAGATAIQVQFSDA